MRDSLNEVDSQDFNCLYYAVYHGHLDVVKMLKMVGVEYKKDGKGTSCLHIAIMRNHYQIVEFFLKRTPKFDELAFSQRMANEKVNKDLENQKKAMLLKRTNLAIQWESAIDIDEQRNDEGISTVFFGIRSGSPVVLKILRQYGANFG